MNKGVLAFLLLFIFLFSFVSATAGNSLRPEFFNKTLEVNKAGYIGILGAVKSMYNSVTGYFSDKFYGLLGSNKSIFDNLPLAIFVFLWIVVFWYIDKRRGQVFSTTFFWKVSSFVVLYVVLGIVPVINRVLQIITLEFLGISLFFRSLFFAGIIYYAPIFIKRYNTYLERRKKYKKKLEEYAIREIERTKLG